MTNNIKSYSKLAKFYSEEFEECSPFNSYYERPGMLNLIGDVKEKYILDVGCAAGLV
ncbi:hypothetical protein ALNOE001_05360 [Candidatus Methanobinarius endosymbioticus]|uniref:Uncharacterized protein n=1 Tax=Candidatus Methanobinarius endosymbioticus TaxID=2006182 RepID=A0A366MCM0_9EURY|nr:hypothetical protein ALNOE001_05360 [Candidatus Methanobinarius endosymbioticus]